MTDDDLIAYLRSWPTLDDIAAADRIEALIKERDVSNEIGRAFEEDAGQQRSRAEKAEDALKEAVAVIQCCPPTSNPNLMTQTHLENVNDWWRNWVRPFLAKHGEPK